MMVGPLCILLSVGVGDVLGFVPQWCRACAGPPLQPHPHPSNDTHKIHAPHAGPLTQVCLDPQQKEQLQLGTYLESAAKMMVTHLHEAATSGSESPDTQVSTWSYGLVTETRLEGVLVAKCTTTPTLSLML